MERLKMCRVCLVEDAPMYVILNREMHEMFMKFTNKPFVTEDRRPVLACSFCSTKLKQCCRFQRKCIEAEELFAQMLDEGNELNALMNVDLEFNNGLIITPAEHFNIVGQCETGSQGIKDELPAEFERLDDINEPKEEFQIDELELEKPDVSNLPGHHLEPEDDVSIRELKIEVEEEQETNWASTAKKANLHIQRIRLEDVITEEQKKNGQSGSKVIRINRTPIPRTGFNEPLFYTKRRPYNCDICQRSFTQKYNLRRHIRIHTGEKPYKCEVCQYSFSDKSNLINHIRIHTGEKLYNCELCQYSCNHTGDLKKHIFKHTNEKPYKCEQCPYSCNQKSCLKRHLMIHTGEKPFKCEVCQRSFNQKISLLNHIPIHTGEKPYKCDLCQYSCIQKGVFTKHIRMHTEKNLSPLTH